jgi:hypothetical protein
MTVYQHAVVVVAEAGDHRLAAEIFHVVYRFNTGTLMDEVKLFVGGELPRNVAAAWKD